MTAPVCGIVVRVDVTALVVAVREPLVDFVAHTAVDVAEKDVEAVHHGIPSVAAAAAGRMAGADLGASGLYYEIELGSGV